MRLMTLTLPATLLTATLVTAAPVSIDRPAKDLPAVERKLHGGWMGEGPCDGELNLLADGTFTRQHYGPGNVSLAGTWTVRWDALPPTLVLTCKNSTDPAHLDKVSSVKLVELDDDNLAYQWPGQSKPVRYKRTKK
jgi:hypothetical protein